MHPIDKKCSADGKSTVAEKIAESRAKNNYCASGSTVTMQYDTFVELQTAVAADATLTLGNANHPPRPTKRYDTTAGSFGEGDKVRFTGWVIKAKNSNTSNGENVNCKRTGVENNDIHVVLGKSPDQDEDESLTAEIIPHLRPSSWTKGNLMENKDRMFRFTGQLFLDSSHKVCDPSDEECGPKRASVWEIHPVYAIDVCKSKKPDMCDPNNNARWRPLHKWVEEEEGPDH